METLKRELKLAVWILEIAAGIFMIISLLGIPHVWPHYREGNARARGK